MRVRLRLLRWAEFQSLDDHVSHPWLPSGYRDREELGVPLGVFVVGVAATGGIPHRAPRMNGPHHEVPATTRLVGLLGWPVEHSLSPTMQNAAFHAAHLDLLYVALPTRPEVLERALEGLEALGFVGANVTAPHKLEVARLLGSDSSSVNTIVVRDGRLEASSTDAAILDDLITERPVVLGDGGAARAFLEALPHARRFSRRETWPPDVRGADLVINATSERDAVLVDLDEGQTLIDLPYPETATAIAARGAGARVVTGLDVLLAQGAASFEIWSGVAAPKEAMRAALRAAS